ncbi:MAG: cytochrome c biogenesis heme-transporting ATPase CcmA [Halieaceae bacterium]
MTAAAAGEPLLAVEGLSLERGGRQLFDGLSFQVQVGHLIQVQGANGAGKTSLMRILAGLSRHGFEGAVKRNGELLYLGHHSAVKGLLSPRENLAWHPSGAEQYTDSAIEQALADVGLYGYEDVPSHALSAGQHRRVNLARLHLSTAATWLLDEPFTAIDAEGVTSLEALLQAHLERGGAVILSSHQALSISYRVHMLDLQEGLL